MDVIKVIMNDGGVIENVYVSPDIYKKGVDLEIIDFCTDDLDELDAAEEAWKEVEKADKEGTLIRIY